MQITKQWLINKNACKSSLDHVCAHKYIGLTGVKFVEKLIKNNRASDANWLIVRIMDKPQKIKYTIFAAKQAINIYDKNHDTNRRLATVIEAAKMYLKNADKQIENANDMFAAEYAESSANIAAYAAYATSNNAQFAGIAQNKMKLFIIKKGLEIINQ